MRGVLFAILLLLAVPALAEPTPPNSDPTDRGPAIGSIIPSDLSSIDHNANPSNFDAVVGENGLVLVFIRSAKWCPFCKKQLSDLADGMDQITARGYALAVLSYDSVNDTQRYMEQHQPGFMLLSDRQSTVIDAFGIRNKKYGRFHFANGVPHPIIFIIDRNKIIQTKLAEKGYKDRPPIAVILEALDQIPPHEE